MEYQITEYNQTAAALTELRSRYVREYDVSTTSGMTEARATPDNSCRRTHSP